MGERDPNREAKWRETMSAWEASGQTVKQFCHGRGLKDSAFYSWRRELRRRDGDELGGGGRGGQRSGKKRTGRFIQLEVGSASSSLRMHVGGELVIDIPATLDRQTLTDVIVAARTAVSC